VSLRITILKYLDAIIGRMMASLLPEPSPVERTEALRSFLIIRPGGIGDAVLLIPTLDLLRSRFPDATLTLLAERRNAGVFELCPAVNRLLCYDKPADLLSVIKGEYDCLIDTEQSHYLSAVMARMVNASVRIGFAGNIRRRMCNYNVEYFQDRYELFSFLDLLKPLGIEAPDVVPTRFVEIVESVREHLPQFFYNSADAPFITLFPGASIAERRWGTDRFHHLLLNLQQIGVRVIVVGGKGEQLAGEQIINGSAGINLAGRTSLMETAAVIESSALLVTADSGMLHLAAGLNKPTVSLFGPGRYRKWAPAGDKHCVLNKHLSCSPCTTFGTTPPCPVEARCMKEITVDEVFNAVTILLTESGVINTPSCRRDMIEVG